MKLQGFSPHGKGEIVISDTPLGKGGEGSVYPVHNIAISGLGSAESLVAKIYHNPQDGGREEKIVAMIASPPKSTSVAWPLCLLRNNHGDFVGFIMTKVAMDKNKTWAQLSHVTDRQKTSKDFDLRYAIMACRNLASAIESIHDAGHKVGDVNESNILVANDAQVVIVDTDSAQIQSNNGKIFPCLVGKPDYTAPELSHGSLKNHTRTEASDVFGYAVAVFQMLTGGAHPTNAKYLGAGDPPSMVEKIRKGVYPGLSTADPSFAILPRVPVEAIPTVYKRILKLCLSVNPEQRPSIQDIIKAQDNVIQRLTQCPQVKTHWYDSKDGKKCPWCQWAKNASNDPWNIEHTKKVKPKSSQKSLPPIGFSDKKEEPITAKRVSTQASTTPSVPRHTQSLSNTAYAPSSYSQGATSTNVARVSQHVKPANTKPPVSHSKPQSPYQKPAMHKGKMIFTNNLGAQVVRPDLSTMFKSGQGKLAIKSFFMEIPDAIKPWWVYYRPFPSSTGFFVSIFVVLLVAASWLPIIPYIYEATGLINQDIGKQTLIYATLLSMGGTTVFGLFFCCSMIPKIRSRNKKFAHYQPYSALRTVGHTLVVSIFYGLGFVLSLVFCLLYIALLVVASFVEELTKK